MYCRSVIEALPRRLSKTLRDRADTVQRYRNELQTSEMFSTAGRSVKTGLVAAAVVSSW